MRISLKRSFVNMLNLLNSFDGKLALVFFILLILNAFNLINFTDKFVSMLTLGGFWLTISSIYNDVIIKNITFLIALFLFIINDNILLNLNIDNNYILLFTLCLTFIHNSKMKKKEINFKQTQNKLEEMFIANANKISYIETEKKLLISLLSKTEENKNILNDLQSMKQESENNIKQIKEDKNNFNNLINTLS